MARGRDYTPEKDLAPETGAPKEFLLRMLCFAKRKLSQFAVATCVLLRHLLTDWQAWEECDRTFAFLER